MAAQPGDDSLSASGLFRSLRRLSSTLLEAVYTRVELARTEVQEEVHHAAKLALWAFVAAFAALMALFMAALTIVFVFWETHRIIAALAVTVLFVAIAVAAALITARKLRSKPALLEATLSELARDRDQLRSGL
ncbi:MAG: phage holin family protein [Gammaproteobacteria bacterium]|nr:hypothetical protein [Gammaproteobacteria bacterium]